jgi:ABC-type microcin C transport system duplicated ATPase subunit YejF
VPLVDVSGLIKSYPIAGSREPRRVVDAVSFQVERGQTLGIVGESGSGKSTVARLLLRLIEPDAGRIHFDGHDLLALSPGKLRPLRRRMQIVFQDPYAALDPRMRMRDIVGEPLAIFGDKGHGSEASERVLTMLRRVGLDESALLRYPHEFSGGQRQRINLARALVLRPDLLVLDEPTSALDVSVSARIVALLQELQRELQLTYLFISHSLPLVRLLSDNILVMQAGRVVEYGNWQAVCEAPQSPYTRALLAATPELPVPSPRREESPARPSM